MEFPFHTITNSEEQTEEIAREYSSSINIGDVVLLNGDLGSGKTFFVKAVCKEYGIKNVSSPSFAIVNEYHNGKKFIHFDFYRIKKIEEIYDLGFEDYLEDDAIKFVEWANLFPNALPKKNYSIDFKFIDNNSREITIIKNG